MQLSVPPITPSVITGSTTGEQGTAQQSTSHQSQQLPQQQASLRGFLSKHEGPVNGPQRGIVSG